MKRKIYKVSLNLTADIFIEGFMQVSDRCKESDFAEGEKRMDKLLVKRDGYYSGPADVFTDCWINTDTHRLKELNNQQINQLDLFDYPEFS